MATKRWEKPRHELDTLGRPARREEFIERLVLPTDTLQGIALLYNTTVGEIKKLNHLQKETDLHARRIIKVPSRGILVDLTEASAIPLLSKPSDNPEEEESDEESTNKGEIYLNSVDTALQEIKEKAETVAANSVVLNASSSDPSLTHMRRKSEDIAWWKIALPCFGILLIMPYLYYLYREHLHDHPHPTNSTGQEPSHSETHYH